MTELLIIGAVLIFTVGFILGTVLSIKQANFEERRTNQVRKDKDKKTKSTSAIIKGAKGSVRQNRPVSSIYC